MKIGKTRRVMAGGHGRDERPAARCTSFTAESAEKIAKAMSLATEDEVNDLKRQGPPSLEEEVSRPRKEKDRKA